MHGMVGIYRSFEACQGHDKRTRDWLLYLVDERCGRQSVLACFDKTMPISRPVHPVILYFRANASIALQHAGHRL